jgi:hypothetical protein
MVADVYNDKAHGDNQVWNQPFVGSKFTTKTLSGDAATALLAQAKKDGVTGAKVKELTIVGTYGVEQSDDYEGPAKDATSSKEWHVYAITDADGKMVKAYMADDKKLTGVASLPTHETDDVPEYFWKPKLSAIDDVLAGRKNSTVENDAHGKEFKFFLDTVLTKGVPGKTRAAFEKEMAAVGGSGQIPAAKVGELKKRYPSIANAYSPEQWQRAFGSRGMDAKAFGAAWDVR